MEHNIIKSIQKLTQHKYVRLLNRGNSAILASLIAAKETSKKTVVLIPDQGGWYLYEKLIKKSGLEPKRLATDDGLVDQTTLERQLNDQKTLAFLYTQPAGYYADQPSKDIYTVCQKHDCFVIMDASGSIGSDLCDGNYADFIVASLNAWKPLDVGYGGILTSKNIDLDNLKIASHQEFDAKYKKKLTEKLTTIKTRYHQLFTHCAQIKHDLQSFKILHPGKNGIVVIVAFDNEEQKKGILDYCLRNDLDYELCPREIRVNRKAISIEVKRK
jgi:dTDP-4-amino-4,6-dideoxygalactose transaminase